MTTPLSGTVDDLIGRLAAHRVLVVGDLVLDEYLTGYPSRVSREAPVLVLEESEREYRAGSAGNPAANIVALGSAATLVGVFGDDSAGEHLASSLAAHGIAGDGLVRASGLQTATKTRILAQGFTGGLYGRQQVLRVDRVQTTPPAWVRPCAEHLTALAPAHDAVLLSDYRGGVVSDEVIAAALRSGRPVTVDSQGDVRRFRGATLVKINQAEAQVALGHDRVMEGGEALRQELGVQALAITLGAGGMALFEAGAETDGSGAGVGRNRTVVPAAQASEVFDVTGAGDTVIAVLTLGLLAGLPLITAAQLANAAASVVIQRLGVATVTPTELRQALSRDFNTSEGHE